MKSYKKKEEMKEISKPWDWSKNTQELWNEPSEESYYLLNRWKTRRFKRFLDLGCGLGRHSLLFANNGFEVDSFDLSDIAVNGLRSRISELGLSTIACATGDMNHLPYQDGTFDCLLAYHVISHTDSRGIKRILSEINRVLKPGAEFYLTLCSKNSWSFREAGYPKLDDDTIMKVEDGPENGIPHFYSDEQTIAALFGAFALISVRHTKDVVFNETALRNSWHYFILGRKKKGVAGGA